jgi:hypothetical protein
MYRFESTIDVAIARSSSGPFFSSTVPIMTRSVDHRTTQEPFDRPIPGSAS